MEVYAKPTDDFFVGDDNYYGLFFLRMAVSRIVIFG